jgi:hypothetical protein
MPLMENSRKAVLKTGAVNAKISEHPAMMDIYYADWESRVAFKPDRVKVLWSFFLKKKWAKTKL